MRFKHAITAFAAAILLSVSFSVPDFDAQAQVKKVGASGLPLPRFVSLKSDKVNVRIGPSQDYGISWTFVRLGLPVEIIQEFDNWRRIRDWEGSEGWIFHSLLSGHRTALVKPWQKIGTVSMYKSPDLESRIVAELEPMVLASVSECNSGWCGISVSEPEVDGWIVQSDLFGIYPDESFD